MRSTLKLKNSQGYAIGYPPHGLSMMKLIENVVQ